VYGMVKLRILGGGSEVGRVGVLIEDSGMKLLLDYGINFDENDHPQFPEHVRPIDLNGIVISHAHLDHIGAAPLLYVSGRVKLYTTKPTIELGKILISDFMKISSYYVDYELTEVESMISNTVYVDYGVEYDIGGFTITPTNAGHILGSLITYIETPSGSTIMYTGDVNTINTWTLSQAELWPKKVDTLIIESTYGARNHPSRYQVEKMLVDSIEEVVDKGGVVLIPAFSVGRSQEVLTLVNVELPYVEVYVDGMAREVTNIYLKHREYLRDPYVFEKAVRNTYFVRGWEDRRNIWRNPCVIIASAGMLKGGPSLYYLKKIWDNPRNAVFLVSYQAINSPGHRVFETGSLEEFGIERIKARLQWFDLSSHSGKDGLYSIVERYKSTLKNIVIVHGDEESVRTFARYIAERIGSDVKIYTPVNGEEIELYS